MVASADCDASYYENAAKDHEVWILEKIIWRFLSKHFLGLNSDFYPEDCLPNQKLIRFIHPMLTIVAMHLMKPWIHLIAKRTLLLR